MTRPKIEGKRQAQARATLVLKPEIMNALRKEADTRHIYFNEFIEFLYNYFLTNEEKKEKMKEEIMRIIKDNSWTYNDKIKPCLNMQHKTCCVDCIERELGELRK